MSSTIKAKMRKRNSVYRRARKTGCPSLWNKYTSLRNQVVNILRQSKREHLRKVSGQGCKQFWKTVKLLKKASSQTPTLKTDTDVASSNTAKTSLLNEVLSQNFNRTISPLANTDFHFFMADPEEIFCITGRIRQQWKTSSVVPIPKSSTNTEDPHNYRPISLLPVISKLVLERHNYV